MTFYCPDCGSYNKPRDGRRGDCRYFDGHPEWAAAGVDPPCALDPPVRRRRWRIPVAAATLASALMLVWALWQPAWSHEAPAGWAYDTSCCSGYDCAVEEGEVIATARGWLIERTGNTVVYGSKKIRQSKDGAFHSCWSGDRRNDPAALLCLYVPPQSY